MGLGEGAETVRRTEGLTAECLQWPLLLTLISKPASIGVLLVSRLRSER